MSAPYNPVIYSYKYLIHLLFAGNSRGFGVHSPYLFDFVRNVLMENKPYYKFDEIENLRNTLKKDKTKVYIKDFGSGNDRVSTVSDIAKKALKPRKQAQLLYRIVNHYKFNNLIELGSCLGISTLYISSVSSKSKCTSFEGAPEIAKIAENNFIELNVNNIDLLVGNIDDTLSDGLNKGPFDFVFMDANHRYEPMMRYFEQIIKHISENAIIVIDDIHHSPEMEKFWTEIIRHTEVTTSIDIYHMGILFTKKHLRQKNYKLAF